MLEQSLRQLNLDTIIEGCQTEATHPYSEETGYCFELFRRALDDQEQAAWAAIDHQYKNLILHWICCGAPTLSRAEAEEIVPQTLPKFWQILHKSSVPLAERFGHVGAVLKYLKQCALSALRDYERRARRQAQIQTRLAAPEQALRYQAESEQELLARIDRERLLELVRRWVETYVTDPQEQRILALSFEMGLTPSQIVEQYPAEFSDVQAVRRIKERVLKRAKRALSPQVAPPGQMALSRTQSGRTELLQGEFDE